MVVGSHQRLSTFDNHDLCVVVNNEPITKVKSTKNLGVTLDENRTWENHINVIAKSPRVSVRLNECVVSLTKKPQLKSTKVLLNLISPIVLLSGKVIYHILQVKYQSL